MRCSATAAGAQTWRLGGRSIRGCGHVYWFRIHVLLGVQTHTTCTIQQNWPPYLGVCAFVTEAFHLSPSESNLSPSESCHRNSALRGEIYGIGLVPTIAACRDSDGCSAIINSRTPSPQCFCTFLASCSRPSCGRLSPWRRGLPGHTSSRAARGAVPAVSAQLTSP